MLLANCNHRALAHIKSHTMSNQKIRVTGSTNDFSTRIAYFHPRAHFNFLTQEETFGALIQDVSTYAPEFPDMNGNVVPADSLRKIKVKIQELRTDKLIQQFEITQYGAEGAVFVPLPEAAVGIVCTLRFESANGMSSEQSHVIKGHKYASGQQVNLFNEVTGVRYHPYYTDVNTFLGLS